MRDECEDFTTKIVFEKPLSTTSYGGVLTDESSFIAFLHKHNIKVDEESLSFAQPSIKSKYVGAYQISIHLCEQTKSVKVLPTKSKNPFMHDFDIRSLGNSIH